LEEYLIVMKLRRQSIFGFDHNRKLLAAGIRRLVSRYKIHVEKKTVYYAEKW